MMRYRSAGRAFAIVVLAGLPASGQPRTERTAAGCPIDPVRFHACAREKMRGFTPPRTRDGHPDFTGHWNRTVQSQDIEAHAAGFGIQAGPSLVIDTPDGRIPYQPWALRARQGMADRYVSPLAACLPPGVPRHVYAPGGHEIVQTASVVVHLLEYSHAYRIIPLTSAPHVDGSVRLWQGDARGRWEGNTLVVDVTNANGIAWLDNVGNFVSEALHVTERFTLVDADTIHYEARIEDPAVYSRPWTMAFALTRNTEPAFEWLEQACHEGNRSVEGGVGAGLLPYRGVVPPAK